MPFERVGESFARYREIMGACGLDHAMWGHISDGNVHPNAMPLDGAQMDHAKRALVEIGMQAIEMGGSPMSEHGVGRSPIKQRLLDASTGAKASRTCGGEGSTGSAL